MKPVKRVPLWLRRLDRVKTEVRRGARGMSMNRCNVVSLTVIEEPNYLLGS